MKEGNTMTHEAKAINFNYEFRAEHKGAPYTLDGIHYMNGGEFAEVAFKAVNGFEAVKDANGRFDLVDDVAELNASVKSGKATLTSVKLGSDFDTTLANYFKAVHSTKWIWVAIIDGVVNWWMMNRAEFAEFVRVFGTWTADRQVIRFKAMSSKMVKWFDCLD